jgi:hypothetical protein
LITSYQDAINNSDIAEPFIILRNPGAQKLGGWAAGAQLSIKAYGTVSVASPKQLNALPEADRITGTRVFVSTTPMYVSSEDLGITSDQLQWKGDLYRVMFVSDRSNRGFYSAVATRMAGQ